MSLGPLRLGVLASRNGSSLRAIAAAIAAGDLAAEIALVVSNNRKAGALAFAAEQGLPTQAIPTQADPAVADVALAEALRDAGVNLVILSGYLRKLGPVTLAAYRDRILNIHPGPLPEFGGEGMYGRRVHEAVIAAGAPRSAAVIHLVDGEYDHGAEIARRWIPVGPSDSAEQLEARVTALEPGFFVEVLQSLAAGNLSLTAS